VEPLERALITCPGPGGCHLSRCLMICPCPRTRPALLGEKEYGRNPGTGEDSHVGSPCDYCSAIYIYIYTYIYTYISIYVYICIHIYIYIQIYTCTTIHIHVYIHPGSPVQEISGTRRAACAGVFETLLPSLLLSSLELSETTIYEL